MKTSGGATKATSGRRRGATAKPPRAYHHGDLRNALIESALALIEEFGPKGFSLNEAARRAGVSSAAPYRHFADKQTLLAAVAEEGTQRLTVELRTAAEADGSAIDRLGAAARAYVSFARRHRGHFTAMFAGDLDKSRFPQLLDASCQTLGAIGERVAAAVPQLDEKAILLLTAEAWATTHGVAALVLDGAFDHLLEGLSAEEMAERLVRARIESATAGPAPRESRTGSSRSGR